MLGRSDPRGIMLIGRDECGQRHLFMLRQYFIRLLPRVDVAFFYSFHGTYVLHGIL